VASTPQPEVWRDVKYITLMPLKDSGKWLLTFAPCGHHQRSHKNTGRARCLQCEQRALMSSHVPVVVGGPSEEISK
jgi:DNA-directed RNA polymerase subunit RPC12/RpoP